MKRAAVINDEMKGQWREPKEGTLGYFLLSAKTRTCRKRQYMEKYF